MGPHIPMRPVRAAGMDLHCPVRCLAFLPTRQGRPCHMESPVLLGAARGQLRHREASLRARRTIKSIRAAVIDLHSAVWDSRSPFLITI